MRNLLIALALLCLMGGKTLWGGESVSWVPQGPTNPLRFIPQMPQEPYDSASPRLRSTNAFWSSNGEPYVFAEGARVVLNGVVDPDEKIWFGFVAFDEIPRVMYHDHIGDIYFWYYWLRREYHFVAFDPKTCFYIGRCEYDEYVEYTEFSHLGPNGVLPQGYQDRNTHDFFAIQGGNGTPWMAFKIAELIDLVPRNAPGFYGMIYAGQAGGTTCVPTGKDGPLGPPPANPGPATCPVTHGGKTADMSVIDNTQLSHIHDAMDYASSRGAAGCTACGAATAGGAGSLPSLRIQRFHRYKDQDRHGSFGPGVFCNYDISLNLSPGIIEFWDPASDFGLDLTDSGGGVYINASHSAVKELRLKDSAGNFTADQAQAYSAVLTHHNGETCTFEIFQEEPGVTANFSGRLVSMKDRNGNAVAIAYADADPKAADAQLNFDRGRLWRMSTITDAYGLSATLTYARADGQWAVQSIALPNGTQIQYGYGANSLVGLNSITYPDGAVSTFGTQAGTNTQGVTYNDAGAEGIHRRKTVNLSTREWKGLSINGVKMYRFPTASNRVRNVVNGAGETSYLNWVAFNDPVKTLYVYEGGGSSTAGTLLRYDTLDGVPLASYRATSFDLNQPVSTYAWQLVEQYTTDSNVRVTETKDGLNRKTVYARDTVSGAILLETRFNANATQYAQSSTTYDTYSQPLQVTDRLGRITTYQYDAGGKGNLLNKTVAVGTADQASWAWTYNAKGQPLTMTDANGHVTDYQYDNRGFLSAIIEPPDIPNGVRASRSFTYDAVGRLASSTDAYGRAATYTYDARNRVTQVLYNDQSTEVFTYGLGANGAGDANLLVQYRDRNQNLTVYDYDNDGRMIRSAVRANFGNGAEDQAVKTWAYLSGTQLPAESTNQGEKTTYAYDFRHRLLATTVRPNNNPARALTSAHHYDAYDRIDFDTDPFGRKTYYLYDTEDRVYRTVRETVPNAIANPASVGSARPADINNASTLINETYFDVEGQVLKRIDPRGIASTFEYDFQGRLKATVAAAGKLQNTFPFSEVAVTDLKVKARTENTYDPQGNLISVKHPRSFDPAEGGDFVTKYIYTPRNLLASKTEAFGRAEAASESYTYYPDRRLHEVADGRGKVWTTVWKDCCARIGARVDPALADGTRPIAIYNQNASGDLTHTARVKNIAPLPTCCTLDPADADTLSETTIRYDARHRPVARTDWLVPLGAVDENNPPIAGDPGYPVANGLTTRWRYDDDLTDTIGLDAAYAAQMAGLGFGVDSNGYAAAETNPNNETTVSIYDGLGRVVKTIDANGNAASVAYDALVTGTPNAPGALMVETVYTDALNHSGRARMDGAGRVLAVYDAENRLSSYTVDCGGNVVTVLDPNNTWINCTFDERSRVTLCTDSRNHTTRRFYDAHSNLIKTRDGLNHDTVCTYDARDRKTVCTDRISGVTNYTYDANNNLLTISDADANVGSTGKKTIYSYDQRNLLEEEQFPENGASGRVDRRKYSYDAAGRVSSRLDQKDELTSYVYDMASRLARRHYTDNLDDVFTYDPAGRVLTAASARYNNVVARSYDAGGRLSGETLTVGVSQNFAVGYAYDAANRQTGMTYPDGKIVARSYSARNQIGAITYDGANVANRVYDVGMRLTSTTYGNGKIETRTYHADNRPNKFVASGVTDFQFLFDENKRKINELDVAIPSNWQSFGYDNEDRLSNFSRIGGGTSTTQTWNLSLVGDWNTITTNGSPDSRQHNGGHELILRNGTPLTYDLKGNLATNSNGQTYTWDVENRLKEAVIPNGAGTDTATYTYDALGRRVTKTVNGSTTVYVSAGMQEIAEYENGAAPANPTREFVFGSYIDEPLMMVSGTNKYYYHSNNLYSTAALTDSTGAVVERYKYDPYGKVTIYEPNATTVRAVSAVGNALLFQGRRLDGETGLYDYRARMYDVTLGRFIGRDPIGYVDGMSLYRAYMVPNSVDPFGLGDPEFVLNWHHMLDQAIFSGTEANPTPLIEKLGMKLAKGIDIHAKEYGHMLRAMDHTYKGGLHPELWSDAWEAWAKGLSDKGAKTITEDMIKAQLEVMKDKFASILAKGKPACMDYKTWSDPAQRALANAAIKAEGAEAAAAARAASKGAGALEGQLGADVAGAARKGPSLLGRVARTTAGAARMGKAFGGVTTFLSIIDSSNVGAAEGGPKIWYGPDGTKYTQNVDSPIVHWVEDGVPHSVDKSTGEHTRALDPKKLEPYLRGMEEMIKNFQKKNCCPK